jgi:mono/diheme cytochrome c family protein
MSLAADHKGFKRLRWAVMLSATMTSLVFSGSSYAGSAERGLVFARNQCAQCHSIDKQSDSPLKNAPPLRTLHQRYPAEALEEALAEGIVTGHPAMPEFQLEPERIEDFVAFLNTLK